MSCRPCEAAETPGGEERKARRTEGARSTKLAEQGESPGAGLAARGRRRRRSRPQQGRVQLNGRATPVEPVRYDARWPARPRPKRIGPWRMIHLEGEIEQLRGSERSKWRVQ